MRHVVVQHDLRVPVNAATAAQGTPQIVRHFAR